MADGGLEGYGWRPQLVRLTFRRTGSDHVFDGLMDGYHVPFLHGTTISPHMHHNILAVDVFGRHIFHATPRRKINEIAGQEPGANPLNRYFASLRSRWAMPNAQAGRSPAPHRVLDLLPVIGRTRIPAAARCFCILTREKVDTEKGREILDKNYKILIDAVMNEDIPAGNGVQRSAAMPAVKKLQLGRNEVQNQMFHSVYERLMATGRWQDTPEPASSKVQRSGSGRACGVPARTGVRLIT